MKDVLSSVLEQNSAKKSDFEKVQWLLSLMHWLQRSRNIDEKNTKPETLYTVRLKYLQQMLSRNPAWQENFVKTISALLLKLSSPEQFSRIGFSNISFAQEFLERIQQKILPQGALSEDLESLVYEIFPDENESFLVDCIDPEALTSLVVLFGAESELQQKLSVDILKACYILCVQVLNNSLAIRRELKVSTDEFKRMPEFILEGELRQALENNDFGSLSSELLNYTELAEHQTQNLYTEMQSRGVKIELVYLFHSQKRRIRRLAVLLNFLGKRKMAAVNLRLFISNLIIEAQHHKSFRSFMSENMSLLMERIVQANSHIGEHYVTYTWSEFRKMFRSAAGGGIITVATVFLKHLVSSAGFKSFLKGFCESLSYSGSFVIIQLLGFTLATKQPSTTAPFIAHEILKSTTEARRSMVALLRTQFICVVGNISTVFPLCFLLSWTSIQLGHPVLGYVEAHEIINSTDIFGPALIFGVFTGVLLFSASVLAGLFENWFITNQIRKRLQYNKKMRSVFGAEKTLKLAEFIDRNANTLSANILLGFLLGMGPQIMHFFNLALEVKHVTLSTGYFGLALPTFLFSGLQNYSVIIRAFCGLALIGILNISVSFVLAFLVASVSSKVKFSSFVKLFKSSLRLLLFKPWLLLIPEKNQSSKAL